ncbi:MAG: hypothetical protein ACRYG8_22660 [Janthinobacterium lividum]
MKNESDDPTGAEIAQVLCIIGLILTAFGAAVFVEASIVVGVYVIGGSL